MEQKYYDGFGPVGNTEKKGGGLWATFEGGLIIIWEAKKYLIFFLSYCRMKVRKQKKNH